MHSARESGDMQGKQRDCRRPDDLAARNSAILEARPMNKKSAKTTAAATSIKTFEAQYRNRYGVVAGYLPHEVGSIGKWLSDQVEAAYKLKAEQGSNFALLPPVNALATLLKNDPGLARQVDQMIAEGLAIHQHYEPGVPYYITNTMDLLVTMNFMIISAPIFAPNVAHYAFPMSGLFVYMMATAIGWDVFRNPYFNSALSVILDWWCRFLCSPASLSVVVTSWDEQQQKGGWLCPKSVIANNLDQFVTEQDKIDDPVHWGFKSFNGFFHRQIIANKRPLAGPGNPRVIVSANDGTVYRTAFNIQRSANFELKSQPYSLENMLDNTNVDYFVCGSVLQTFLSGHDYHRWSAPISGKVVYARVVPGYLFSELPIAETGFDAGAGVYSQGYDANVNTRALIFIESPDPAIGIVCVMPIGITEISSISIQVYVGQNVAKGQQLGWFSYGGSSLALIFKQGAIDQFTVGENDPVQVKGQIAIASG
jgi:phosphatidylserine decarboxylase